jgi:hypothetical protein
MDPCGLVVLFAAYGCGRAAGLLGDVNPYVTEIAAMVVVLIAGLWTARAEVDDDRTGAASTAVGRRFARCALGATAEAAPLIARCDTPVRVAETAPNRRKGQRAGASAPAPTTRQGTGASGLRTVTPLGRTSRP